MAVSLFNRLFNRKKDAHSHQNINSNESLNIEKTMQVVQEQNTDNQELLVNLIDDNIFDDNDSDNVSIAVKNINDSDSLELFNDFDMKDDAIEKTEFLENSEKNLLSNNPEMEFFSNSEMVNSSKTFYLSGIVGNEGRFNFATAKFLEENCKMLIIKGSYMKKSFPVSYEWISNVLVQKVRREILNSQCIEEIDGLYRLTSDFVIDSPSIATFILLGEIVEDPIGRWNDINYISMKDFVIIKDNKTGVDKDHTDHEKNDENEDKKRIEYNLTKTYRFLEEVYDTTIISHINDDNKWEFLIEFDEAINLLKQNSKQILISRYGLIDGVTKTFLSTSKEVGLSVAGVKASIDNSINILKKSSNIESLKKYFDLGSKYDDDEQKKRIREFILSTLKD